MFIGIGEVVDLRSDRGVTKPKRINKRDQLSL